MPECHRAFARAGSRIHLGFHAVPSAEKVWAGAGIYLDAYHTLVEARPSREASVEPPELEDTVRAALEANGLTAAVRIHSHAPRHQGLGSTTQLVLASLAAAYTARHGRAPTKSWLVTAAARAGRGRNGWVGTLLYSHGGFVACTGRPVPLHAAPLPRDWVVVLVRPRLPRGLPERGEQEVIQRLPPASERLLALMQRGLYTMLRGLADGDVDLFNQGLARVQAATGEYFSRAQGGVYRSDLARIVDEAQRDGILLGQSSWGPTLYAVTTRDRAPSDAKTLRMITRILGVEALVETVEPRNMPAEVWCDALIHKTWPASSNT